MFRLPLLGPKQTNEFFNGLGISFQNKLADGIKDPSFELALWPHGNMKFNHVQLPAAGDDLPSEPSLLPAQTAAAIEPQRNHMQPNFDYQKAANLWRPPTYYHIEQKA